MKKRLLNKLQKWCDKRNITLVIQMFEDYATLKPIKGWYTVGLKFDLLGRQYGDWILINEDVMTEYYIVSEVVGMFCSIMQGATSNIAYEIK